MVDLYLDFTFRYILYSWYGFMNQEELEKLAFKYRNALAIGSVIYILGVLLIIGPTLIKNFGTYDWNFYLESLKIAFGGFFPMLLYVLFWYLTILKNVEPKQDKGY